MAVYVKVGGTWRTATTDSPTNGVCGYVKVNGTWRTVNQSYVKINGVWRATCTAPGQQPPAIPESICYRPNYCLNGTNGVILPTTEPCYMPDGVTLGTRTAPYTCQTDPGCISYTVPAGTCTVPDPIISVVSEQIGDCEFWGGLSGCTNGNAKRITRRMSDNSVKVSYSCCDPLQPNLKYYCTLRPYSTGQCLNELKDTDFTGTVVAGQGEWVCEALGITSFPSCSTRENCATPKTSTSTYEGCGYLNTGQRLVTTNTYQSWCDTTLETVIGDCIGADDPCGGKYCGEGSGEEEYPNAGCQSGSAIRYKCLTPEGCAVKYTFRRCTTYTPPPPPAPGPGPAPTLYFITEVCRNISGAAISCNQYSSYSIPASTSDCTVSASTSTYSPCPQIQNPTGPTAPTGPVAPSCGCIEDSDGYCNNGIWYQYRYDPNPACPACPARNTGSPCGTGTGNIDCTPCTYGSGTQSCGNGGTQTYCITPVGCPNRYGDCIVPGQGTTNPPADPISNPTGPTYTPTGPTVYETGPTGDNGQTTTWETNQTTDGGALLVLRDDQTQQPIGEPIYIPDLGGLVQPKIISVNINTLIRTKDGLVPAFELKVGDKLLSADINTFPYDNLLASNMDLLEWTAQNPHINLVETEIVGLRVRVTDWAVIVNGEIFSESHYILVNRNDEAKFVKSMDLEATDLIWSYEFHTWIGINKLVKVDVKHEVVSIDCEPYDIFFTERMLTHDSHSVD